MEKKKFLPVEITIDQISETDYLMMSFEATGSYDDNPWETFD